MWSHLGGQKARKRQVFYDDHMVEMLRAKVGQKRADLLLHDAARGRNAQFADLGKALNASIHTEETSEGTRHFAVITDRSFSWVGAHLALAEHLPETIISAIIGRRLGDVVAGAGAEDHIIEHILSPSQGTRICIQTDNIDARSFQLSKWQIIAGPFRRSWRTVLVSWHDVFIDSDKMPAPNFGGVIFELVLLVVATMASLIALAIGPHIYGRMGFIASILLLPLPLWACSGLAASLILNARRWLQSMRDTSASAT